ADGVQRPTQVLVILLPALDGQAQILGERIGYLRDARAIVEHAAGARRAGLAIEDAARRLRLELSGAWGDHFHARAAPNDDAGPAAHLASAATCILTMRSGLLTDPLCPDPFLILSIASMPETTSP